MTRQDPSPRFGDRYYWVLLLPLLVLLLVAALALLDQQHRQHLDKARRSAQNELRFLTSSIKDALQNRNYQIVERIVAEWGTNSPDTVEIRLSAANGFVLAHYQRLTPAAHSYGLSTYIQYSYRGTATLSLSNDLDRVYAQRTRLAIQLIAGVVLIGAAFGYFIYTANQRRREAAVLRARTTELNKANIDLQHEVKQRKQAEEALFQEKERAEVTLHSIGDAVITTDPHGVIIYLNPIAEELTAWPMQEALGQPLSAVFHVVNEITRQPTEDPVAKCLAHGRPVALANHSLLISRDGREYVIEDSAAPIRSRTGEVLGVVLVFKDATEHRRLIQKITHQAKHDSLTGLTNRGEFEQRLDQALHNARSGKVEHALCYLDLDQFKIVNDTCGHIAGDALLQQVSMLPKKHIRSGDTFARLGGDEFGILLENCALDDALNIANALCEEIRNYRFMWDGKAFDVGVSIGLVPITATESITQLLSHADLACYMAKDLGRNRVHVYTVEDEALSRRQKELHLASTLSGALERNSFRLYCQSIRALNPEARSGAEHYEVLLRLVDSDGKEISPTNFIPAAERYNLMPAIDRWVIRNTLACFASFRHKLAPGPIFISINLSGNSLSDENLQSYIEEQLRDFDVPAETICFEITETGAITNLSHATRFMQALKGIGCRFALDDFGSGLSSFAYLKNLPVDFLKIDGEFVRQIVDDPIAYAMVGAINHIGHVMGIETIAEFAENDAIIAALTDLGVDYAQGYGIGMPKPVEQMQSDQPSASHAK